MAQIVIMPKEGITVESCIIGAWRKNIGDPVAVDEVLFEYETDKAAFECLSTAEGVLLHRFYLHGEEAPVLKPVAIIGEAGEDVTALVANADTQVVLDKVAEAVTADIIEAQAAGGVQTYETRVEYETQAAGGAQTHEARVEYETQAADGVQTRYETDYGAQLKYEAQVEYEAIVDEEPDNNNEMMKASPRARGLAADLGIDLNMAEPTGPDGRILAADVVAAANAAYLTAPNNTQRYFPEGERAAPENAQVYYPVNERAAPSGVQEYLRENERAGQENYSDGERMAPRGVQEYYPVNERAAPENVQEYYPENEQAAPSGVQEYLREDERAEQENYSDGERMAPRGAQEYYPVNEQAAPENAQAAPEDSQEYYPENERAAPKDMQERFPESERAASISESETQRNIDEAWHERLIEARSRELEAEKRSAGPAAQAEAVHGPAYADERFSNIRAVIARTMMASVQRSAQVTNHHNFDATSILTLREEFKTSDIALGYRNVSVGDIILYAASRVLAKHPEINALVADEGVRKYYTVNLGVAIDTPRGLMVPTVFGAEKLSLKRISGEVKALAAAAKEGRISPDRLSGGTFTVSNLGATGVEFFTPIINPPQAAILGVCGVTERVRKGEKGLPEIYPSIGLSFTYDHRAVDGAPASRFVAELCTALTVFSWKTIALDIESETKNV